MTGEISVIATLAPLLPQDAGRAGLACIGVPGSGAFDRAAARLAQRLVGNPEDGAALEVTLGGVVLATSSTVTAAVTGASVPIRVGGQPATVGQVFSWRAGQQLELGIATAGLRSYVAVHGGYLLPRVLGSASSDLLSGLGPPPIMAGDTVRLAHGTAADPIVSHTPVAVPVTVPLRLLLGPRDDWFARPAVETLLSAEFRVAPDSNRIGIRLGGPQLSRRSVRELLPEPLVRGAIQVTRSGHPIIMGPDHPTTGGYPVIATVVEAHWDACAHLRPGDQVRFSL